MDFQTEDEINEYNKSSPTVQNIPKLKLNNTGVVQNNVNSGRSNKGNTGSGNK